MIACISNHRAGKSNLWFKRKKEKNSRCLGRAGGGGGGLQGEDMSEEHGNQVERFTMDTSGMTEMSNLLSEESYMI